MAGQDEGGGELARALASWSQQTRAWHASDSQGTLAEQLLRLDCAFLEISNRSTEMTPLLREWVRLARTFSGCTAVGIRILDQEGNIPYEAYEGFSDRFYELESPLSIKSDECMCINVVKGATDPELPYYTDRGSFYMNTTTRFLAGRTEEEKKRTRNVCNEFGYESVALVPIQGGERIIGLIHVADLRENMVPPAIVEVLEDVAMKLGIAITRLWAQEEARKANLDLERRVKERTADLTRLNTEFAREIAERRRTQDALSVSEERFRLLSVIDELTGLYNRRHFYEVLDSEMSRSQRYGRPFSLVILDVDGFKEYNDRFGHTNGDNLLKSLAQTLKSASRKADTAFRYGGDEFAIVLPATDADKTMRIVDRIRSKWIQASKAENFIPETPLAFSAGVSQFPQNAETGDGLVFLADTALYCSKGEGGCKCTSASDLREVPQDILDRATMEQVCALAATVDAREAYTYGHSKRVAGISELIGKATGLSTEELATVYAASLLHDIGKVGVSDSILTKAGKPTENEWRSIRKHPVEGARIVSYVEELAAFVPMILHHHEWHDGTGYPDALKGEEIPLGARIISIADAYDTMTTKRTYREVVSQKEALEELRRCSGTQFDPELVEALCQIMSEATG